MPSATVKAEPRGWFAPALVLVVVVVAARLLALAFDRTDLFVDETQYWFWGQRLDFGYYSKPPLIGWLLRAVTELAGSDAPFWLRMPGAVLHGATALILGALAARLADARAALWAVALYLSAPFVALGSILISTDTVMAPFFAAALLYFWRAGERRNAGDAALAGLCLGLAFMAKYAALYLVPGMALAAALVPERRIGWRNAVVLAAVFALVAAPNVVWNLTHKLATFEHTMDNVGWVRAGAEASLASALSFFAAQFAVFGPVLMAALLWGLVRPRTAQLRALAALSVLPLLAVTAQAFLGTAQANWAVAAYFAGTVLAVLVLPRWARWLALAVNALACVVLPLTIVLAPWPEWHGKPLLKRYLGRAEMSTRILALAKAEGVPVYAQSREILADLFYTGRLSGVTIYAPARPERPMNYYEQNFALPESYEGQLLVIRARPLDCGAGNLPPAGLLNGGGTWEGKGLTPYLAPAECVRAED